MKLIDKDVLVAEINKRIIDAPINNIGHQRVWAYNDVKDILDTLEVKEVDLEKELESLHENEQAIEHPTGGELLHVLNKGHEQGWKDAVEKACEYLKTSHEDIGIRYIRGHEVEDEIEIFKNYMEGQQ